MWSMFAGALTVDWKDDVLYWINSNGTSIEAYNIRTEQHERLVSILAGSNLWALAINPVSR